MFIGRHKTSLSIHGSVDLIAFSFDIEANEKFYHRCPVGNTLGVHIVDIPRIKFFI